MLLGEAPPASPASWSSPFSVFIHWPFPFLQEVEIILEGMGWGRSVLYILEKALYKMELSSRVQGGSTVIVLTDSSEKPSEQQGLLKAKHPTSEVLVIP